MTDFVNSHVIYPDLDVLFAADFHQSTLCERLYQRDVTFIFGAR